MSKQQPRLDSEYRGNENDHQALRLWLRMLTCTNMVENQLRTRLRKEFDSTLPRFDMMAQLYRHPEGLRMGALSQLMMVSGGNVTGISNQLEKEQLIEREVSPGDRRAFVVKLSPKGVALFEKMSAAHENWVIELFSELESQQNRELMSLLKTVKDSMLNQGVE